MAFTMNTTGGNGINSKENTMNKQLGWLTWWTIEQRERSSEDLKASAQACGIPDWMVERLNGRTQKSAWLSATQLGGKGKVSIPLTSEPSDVRARYLTRELSADSRLLVREVLRPTDEKASASSVARLYFGGTGLSFEVESGLDTALEAEVRRVIDGMARSMSTLEGQVDDGRIRALLITWLERNHRVVARGSGGVYFVPMPLDQADQDRVRAELQALACWVSSEQAGGMFSIVDIFDGGATTVQTFRAAAVEELKAEIEEVNSRLDAWKANENMNAGSLAFSAETMVARCAGLGEKASVLIGSLGEEVAVIQSMLTMVTERASRMTAEASAEVDQARTSKRETTLAERERRAAEAAAKREADRATKAAAKATEAASVQADAAVEADLQAEPVADLTEAEAEAMFGQDDEDAPITIPDVNAVPKPARKRGPAKKSL